MSLRPALDPTRSDPKRAGRSRTPACEPQSARACQGDTLPCSQPGPSDGALQATLDNPGTVMAARSVDRSRMVADYSKPRATVPGRVLTRPIHGSGHHQQVAYTE